MVKLIEYRQFAKILALFLVTQLAGILLAFYFVTPVAITPIASQPSVSESGLSFIATIIIYIVIGGVIMTLLFKAHKGPKLFRGIEAVAIFSATFYLFFIVLSALFPQDFLLPTGLAVLLSLGLIAAKNKWQWLRNFTAVVASIGVGFGLGVFIGIAFGFFAAFAILAAIAVYDYVAVFITKHMVTMGKEAVDRNLALLVGAYDIEVVPKSYIGKKEAREWTAALRKGGNEQIKSLVGKNSVAIPMLSALGAGDLAFPLMLAVSAYTTYFSYFTSLMLVAGASVGLVFTLYISKTYRMALPAIPPLFSFSSFGLAAAELIASPADWQLPGVLIFGGIAILAILLLTAIRQSRMGGGQKIFDSKKAAAHSMS